MDFLIRDCILCPITNVLQKRRKKKCFFFWFITFITLIHLRDNHCSQNNSLEAAVV